MKGFIRSYADFLGLDSTVALERYTPAVKVEEVKEEERKPEPKRSYSRYIFLGVLISFLIAFIIINRLFLAGDTDEMPTTAEPDTQAGIEKPLLANITAHGIFTTAEGKLFQPLTAPKMPISPPARQETYTIAKKAKLPAIKYNLLITARELTWLRITVDNREPVEVLMRKGEKTTWAANHRLTVLSGNAGGVELTLNGKPLGSMGEPGKMVTKVLPE